MQQTLKEIATLVHGEVVGDERTIITGIGGIKEARAGDLTFLANVKYLPLLKRTAAAAVITSREIARAPKPIIRTENPSLAFSQVVEALFPPAAPHPRGTHPAAVVSPRARLGRDVAVGPHAVIEDDAVIGDGVVLSAGVYVGQGVRIGEQTLIYPLVVMREGTAIGRRVIIHGGTVIGSDGFGFETVGGVHHKIPQRGTVVIEDDVEIGANCTIDRARFGVTRIGRGTKIDNLVHIAHNVTIGEHSLLVAQVGISGSTTLGHHVTLAGQVGVVGHVTIGDHTIVGAQGGITKSVPAGSYWWGTPARDMEQWKKIYALTQLLPKLHARIDALTTRVDQLKEERHGATATDHCTRHAR